MDKIIKNIPNHNYNNKQIIINVLFNYHKKVLLNTFKKNLMIVIQYLNKNTDEYNCNIVKNI
jgi:hypothetical protein